MIKRLFILVVPFFVAGCVTLGGNDTSLAQRAYLVKSDYLAIQRAAAMYVVKPTADPWVKQHIKEADARATPAVIVMGNMVQNLTLSFCETGVKPANLDQVFVDAACAGDTSAVIAKTSVLVGMLNSIMIQIEGGNDG